MPRMVPVPIGLPQNASPVHGERRWRALGRQAVSEGRRGSGRALADHSPRRWSTPAPVSRTAWRTFTTQDEPIARSSTLLVTTRPIICDTMLP